MLTFSFKHSTPAGGSNKPCEIPAGRATHARDPIRIDIKTLRVLPSPTNRRLRIMNRCGIRSFTGKPILGHDTNISPLSQSLRQRCKQRRPSILPAATKIHHNRRREPLLLFGAVEIQTEPATPLLIHIIENDRPFIANPFRHIRQDLATINLLLLGLLSLSESPPNENHRAENKPISNHRTFTQTDSGAYGNFKLLEFTYL